MPLAGRPVRGHRLPCAPVLRRLAVHRRVGVVQQPPVPGDRVVVARRRGEPVPLLGEHHAHAAAEQPIGLAAAPGRDAPQHQLADPGRVPLGVGQRQLTPERPAPHQPAVDIEQLTHRLDVVQQVRCGVGLERRQIRAGAGRAAPAAALVEQHDAVALGVEHLPVPRLAARAGAAVQHQGGLPSRVSAHLPVDVVAVAGGEHSVLLRLDRRVALTHPWTITSLHRVVRTAAGRGRARSARGACRRRS